MIIAKSILKPQVVLAYSEMNEALESNWASNQLLEEAYQTFLATIVERAICNRRQLTMNRYEAYKDSGVEWIGEIPAGWEVKPIWTLATYNDEVLPDTTDGDKQFRYIDISSVSEGHIDSTSLLVFKDAPSRARRIIRRNDIVISTVRTYLKAIALIGVKHDGCIASTGFCVLRPNGEADCRWFGYAVSEESFVEEIVAKSEGVSYPAINASEIVKLRLRVPPLAEQRAIADCLDKKTAAIDGLVADCEREIELLQEYRKTVISEAVTKGLDPNASMKDSGIEWIGEIPEGWSLIKLSHIASATLGKMLDSERQTGKCQARYLSNRNVQWFKIDSIDLKEMDFPLEARESFKILDGDLLVCEGGEVGRCAVWHGASPDFYFQKAIHRVRFDRNVMDPDFAAYQMFQKAQVTMLREVRKGESTIGHLPGDQLSRLMMLVPPLAEQREIVAYLDAKTAEIDSLIDSTRQMIEKLREYRKSLISEAVTGKFKVPGV